MLPERAGALAEEHQWARGSAAVRGRHALTPSARTGRCRRGVGLRRPCLDRVGGAAPGAGAAAEALLVVVHDGAVHGDSLRHLDGSVGLVPHQAAQGGAELAAAAALRRVQELVHVEEVAALGGAGRAVPGAGAAADAELFVADDLAADADGAPQRAAGHAAEDLASAVGERHQAAPLAAASSPRRARRRTPRRPRCAAPGSRRRRTAARAAGRRSRGPSRARRPRTWAAHRRSS